MKICLTANSGGHLNQLIQLKALYSRYDHFFVTDRNSFSEELAKTENVYFVQKFIIREVISKFQFLKPLKNIVQSLVIFFKERPRIIITTGAGTSMGIWLMGKIFFQKTIFIESVARTDEPSTFGKIIGRRSGVVFVQWEKMLNFYKKGVYSGLIFDFKNVKIKGTDSKIKKIFLTAGTYKLQFNRLLNEVDRLIEKGHLNCKISAQIGSSDYLPKHFDYFDYCGQKQLHKAIEESDLVICQGGSGSIMDSLLRGKRVIAIPRLPEFNEFFDNHQIQLSGELERLGLILAVYEINKLGDVIEKAKDFKPDFRRINQTKFYDYLEDYINRI